MSENKWRVEVLNDVSKETRKRIDEIYSEDNAAKNRAGRESCWRKRIADITERIALLRDEAQRGGYYADMARLDVALEALGDE